MLENKDHTEFSINTDLRPDQVLSLLQAIGLDADPGSLAEVCYRFNALREALGTLEQYDVDDIEPTPVFWLNEESQHGQ